MNDIDIEKNAKILHIAEIAKKIGLDGDGIDLYGKFKAKVDPINNKKEYGKLILVTASSPTRFGEGKTTVSIGLADGLSRLGKRTILALREPSLGPVFGIKGGAAGGGYAQVAPMVDINLHFTGDLHAITSANNLLSAAIDNHLHFGNALNLEKITWQRCVDLNDRALRNVVVGLGKQKDGVIRSDNFTITAASEIMAVLCLSQDINDLKRRLGDIIIGYNSSDEPVYCKDLKVEESMTILLKDALRPNLVQTLENTPAFIHGGPFANIAHGCNSLVATQTALSLSDYAVTEAGFGADLGAEKFIDIKCKKSGIFPDVVVIVTTIRSLVHNSGKGEEENLDKEALLEIGVSNLVQHIQNLKQVFGVNIVVALNKFNTDNQSEIDFVSKISQENGADFSVCTAWGDGGKGALDLAEKVVLAAETKVQPKFAYDDNLSIKEKISAITKNIYKASSVNYSTKALKSIDTIEKNELGKLPICIAKTQYSFSDDPLLLGAPKDYVFNIQDVYIKNGAGFIVALAGEMMLMPGLSKSPALERMKIDNNLDIQGLF